MQIKRRLISSWRTALGAAAVVSVFCMPSCLSHHDTVVAEVNPAGWHDAALLVYGCVDTVTLKEAAMVLRHAPAAEPRNGVYIVEALSPSGAVELDTVNIVLSPAPSGNKLQETRVPFRSGVRLAERGDYIFKVTPPRGTNGIWSVAIDFN